MAIEYISKQHRIGDRSIPEKEFTSGKISTVKACLWFKDGNAAIFNRSIPYDRYYVNGIETDIPTISKGDSFVNADCYKEGIEGTYAMILNCMGYLNRLGIRVRVTGGCGSCDNDGVVSCMIRTTHKADVENVSRNGSVVYNWEVAGGSLVSGQGTDTIVVETIGIYSVNVAIRCTVTDKYTSAYDEYDCLHKRENNAIGDTVLVPHVALKPADDLVPYTGRIK